jgi:hypothetical protein
MFSAMGAIKMASETSRDLRFHWPVNVSLGCPVEKLFDRVPFRIISNVDVNEMLLSDFSLKVYNAGSSGKDQECYQVSRKDEHDIILIKTWIAPNFYGEGPLKVDFSGWSVNREIMLKAAVIDKNYVGVHVRRGDHPDLFKDSTDEWFFKMMTEEGKNKQFFLSTDDKKTEEEFIRKFPGRVRIMQKDGYGWSSRMKEESIKEAMVDLMALSRCSKIIGTKNSTFSCVPALIGKIPLLRL